MKSSAKKTAGDFAAVADARRAAKEASGRREEKVFRPRVGPAPGTDFVFYVSKLMTWTFFPITFQFRVSGRHNIPLDTGALVASNHQSYLDPVFLGAAARRRTGYIARKTLFKAGGFFTRVIETFGAIPLSIESSGKEGVRLAVEHLKRKEHLVMFPEGTRTHDGSIGPVQPGVKLIAQKADVPIIPAAVCGAFEIWPRKRKLFGFGPVSVAFGRPIWPDELRKMHADEFCAYLRARLQALYAKLCEEKSRRSFLSRIYFPI
jgi:1-acyl-sn-glycerol-3-phosphate acyltransferase